MENVKKFSIVVSIALVFSIAVHLQNEYVDWREEKKVAQDQILQVKYDEGHAKGYEEGFTEQLTDDEKFIIIRNNILNKIVNTIKAGEEVNIITEDGTLILVEKPNEE